MKIIQSYCNGHVPRIGITIKRKIQMFPVDQILYCEADRNYTILYLTTNEKYMVSHPLSYVNQLLKEFGFVSIHRSILVNTLYISAVSRERDSVITLTNQTELKIARRKKTELLKTLFENPKPVV